MWSRPRNIFILAKPMIKYVTPFPIPKISDFDPDAVQCLFKMDHRYRRQEGMSIEAMMNWLGNDPVNNGVNGPFDWQNLSHELSPFMIYATDQGPYPQRTITEILAFQSLSSKKFKTIIDHGFDSFSRLLLEFSSSIRPVGGYRTVWVGTGNDNKGGRVIFPPPSQIENQLFKLFEHLKLTIDVSPIFGAIVLYNGIANIHPFRDGNGRVARMAFNWVMRDISYRFRYIPIYEIGILTKGALLIHMRQAQYHGNWKPLIQFFEKISAPFLVNDICFTSSSNSIP